jgi:hypothetical protein
VAMPADRCHLFDRRRRTNSNRDPSRCHSRGASDHRLVTMEPDVHTERTGLRLKPFGAGPFRNLFAIRSLPVGTRYGDPLSENDRKRRGADPNGLTFVPYLRAHPAERESRPRKWVTNCRLLDFLLWSPFRAPMGGFPESNPGGEVPHPGAPRACSPFLRNSRNWTGSCVHSRCAVVVAAPTAS